MSIMSDEVNFLVYRYLQEAGYHHSAFSFGLESHIAQSNVNGKLVPPGALISILQKGIQYIEGELCVNDDGTMIDDLDNIPPIPLIDAVIPEALAHRAATLYRTIAQKTELAKNLAISPNPAIDNNKPQEGVIPLRGHESEVFTVAWSPTSQALASGDANSVVCIWNLEDVTEGKDMKMVKLNHRDESNKQAQSRDITSLQWSPDGALLAVASAQDFVIRIWKLEGTPVASLPGHKGVVFALKWNHKGTHLLSSSFDKKCIVWDTTSWEKLQTYEFHSGPVMDIDWQSNSSFASCSTDKLIYVYNVGEEKPTKMFAGHLADINCVRWHPKGTLLASGADDRLIKIWGMKHEQPTVDLSGHTREVTQVEWDSNSTNILASASYDTSVKLWNTEQGVCLHTLNRHLEPVNSISFSMDGKYLASGTLDGLVNFWAVQEGKCLHTHRCSAGVFEVDWSKDGHHVAVCQSDKMVKILDARKMTEAVS